VERPALRIDTAVHGDTTTLGLAGEIDLDTAGILQSAARRALERPVTHSRAPSSRPTADHTGMSTSARTTSTVRRSVSCSAPAGWTTTGAASPGDLRYGHLTAARAARVPVR